MSDQVKLSATLVGALLGGFLLLSAGAHAGYPWAKQPGPIQGEWRTTCRESGGMTIMFSVSGSKATGRIGTIGSGKKYGYSQGEEILRLTGTDLGKWAGQLHWRSVSGTSRWDPITFIVKGNDLDAVQTTDQCYRNMPRVK